MKRLKEIGKALKSVVLSMAHMDYQMEFKKRKKAKTKGGEDKVTWFDNYWGWLERLVKKLRKWIEE